METYLQHYYSGYCSWKQVNEVSLREQSTTITEYDESLVRRLIEKVTVYEGKFTVEFKSGVTVDVDE